MKVNDKMVKDRIPWEGKKHSVMNKNVGVWIDSRKAVVVNYEGGVSSFLTIPSEIEKRVREEGGVKDSGKFGHQFHNHQKSREKKLERDRDAFIKSVINELKDADGIVIYGPSQMKNELKKGIMKVLHKADLIKDVLPADSLTDNQIVAMVVNYFGKVSVEKA
jgi:hypothetical protein